MTTADKNYAILPSRMVSSESAFRAALEAAFSSLCLAPTQHAVTLMHRHYAAMVEANRSFNLTRITEPADAAVKHYADSAALVAWAQQRGVAVETLLDVGTGAGFPAVVLAILRPDWRITAIDGTRKKTDFVARVAGELHLTNLTVVHARAEHWTAPAPFSVVTTRAVASLADCLRICREHVARAGHLVAYKTADLDPAEESAARAAAKSDFAAEPLFGYELTTRGDRLARSLRIYRRA